jgi:hypothetical protein
MTGDVRCRHASQRLISRGMCQRILLPLSQIQTKTQTLTLRVQACIDHELVPDHYIDRSTLPCHELNDLAPVPELYCESLDKYYCACARCEKS